MNPSNSTVFRFIATYGKGFDELVQRLILGYGYMNDGGLSHQDLVWLYLGSKRDYTNKLYAGYFTVENGLLRIFSGGVRHFSSQGPKRETRGSWKISADKRK